MEHTGLKKKRKEKADIFKQLFRASSQSCCGLGYVGWCRCVCIRLAEDVLILMEELGVSNPARICDRVESMSKVAWLEEAGISRAGELIIPIPGILCIITVMHLKLCDFFFFPFLFQLVHAQMAHASFQPCYYVRRALQWPKCAPNAPLVGTCVPLHQHFFCYSLTLVFPKVTSVALKPHSIKQPK